MPCKGCSNKITSDLRCSSCGYILRLRHRKDLDVMYAVATMRRNCNRCGNSTFQVVDKNDDRKA